MNTGIFILGLVILLAGIGAYIYTVSETDSYFFGAFSDTDVSRPYQHVALPLIIIGIALAVVGALMSNIKTRTEYHSTVPEKRKKVIVEEE